MTRDAFEYAVRQVVPITKTECNTEQAAHSYVDVLSPAVVGRNNREAVRNLLEGVQ